LKVTVYGHDDWAKIAGVRSIATINERVKRVIGIIPLIVIALTVFLYF